jgi:ribonuclease VapC
MKKIDIAAKIYDSPGCTTSALVVLEAVMRLTSKQRVEPHEALARLEAFLGEASVVVTAIEPGHVYLAVEAFARFGKGRGHPAQLNLADCSPTPAPRAAAFRCFTRAMISPVPT